MSFIMLLLFSLSIPSFADIMNDQVYEIDQGVSPADSTLVFLRSGRVLKVPKSNLKMTQKLMTKIHTDEMLTFNTNINNEILSVENLEQQNNVQSTQQISDVYMPSVLVSQEQAQKYFNESRFNSKDSQCFNRAHVWTHEWRVKHNFYSMKAFIFFSKKYIRKYNFDWWFHVAPLIHIVDQNRIEERVMDIKYSRGPRKMRDWSNIFMKDNSQCLIINNYSDFADWPESSNCYIMRTSMYYYQPLDMENLEKFGYEKNRWIESEVMSAYAEAFNLAI